MTETNTTQTFTECIFYVADIKILHMNKNSMTIELNDTVYLITRRLFNQFIRAEKTMKFWIVEKEYLGSTQKWLALPSIF